MNQTQKSHTNKAFQWTFILSLLALFLFIEITCGLFVVQTLMEVLQLRKGILFPFTIEHVSNYLHIFCAILVLFLESIILKTCLHNMKKYEINEIKEQKQSIKSS